MEQSQDQTQDINNSEEGGEAAPPPALQPAAIPPPAAEPSGPDKLKARAGKVDPPAIQTPATQAAVESFKANLKFKAAGKEHEVPELLRGVMKDAESEKYLHTMLSKAHGIEMVQEKLKETRAQRDQVHQAYSKVMEPINYAREAYGRGDLDTMFNTLKMDPNKVLQWAYNKVQLSQMSPEQRQLHEGKTAAERRAWELERQTATQSSQHMDAQAEQITQMLDVVMERQDVDAIAQAYDGKRGKQGAFRDLVSQIGDQEYHRSGKIINPLDAVKHAVELIGEKFGAPATPAAAAPAPAAATPAAAQAVKPKPILPNVGGAKASAPGKGKISTLDDIKKAYTAMAQSK